MSSFTSFMGLLFVFAFSMGTMANPANPTGEKTIAIKTFADLQQQPAEQQIESFDEAPANQDAAPTDATGTDVTSDSASSESSEEMTSDTADGSTAASIFNGGLPNPNVETELVNNPAAPASGNQLPMKGSNLPSNQGVSMASSSSVSGAGIAIAVVAMVGFVVGTAVFVIRKYRHNFPVFVRE